MGVRASINDNPRVAAVVVAAVLLIACAFAALQFFSAGTDAPSDEAFFTTDDGKTWFVDAADKLPPFTRDGKPAVRAYVFECDGKHFTNHLERFTPDGLKAAEAQRGGQSDSVAGQIRLTGVEVKRPGAQRWVPLGDLTKAGPILRPTCPNGSGTPTPVQP